MIVVAQMLGHAKTSCAVLFEKAQEIFALDEVPDKWKSYIGLNEVRFGRRGKHFEAAPGRYVADLRATDYDNNTSRARTVHFRIDRAG